MIDLMICGAMRSGTTSLANHLKAHPEIATINEPQLLLEGRDVGWPFASPIFAHYQQGYDPALYAALAAKVRRPGTRIVLTKQPYFMVFPHIAFGLREQLPAARLIFTLRNQADMLYSAFHTLYRTGERAGARFEDFLPLTLLKGESSSVEGFEMPARRRAWHFEYWNRLGDEMGDGAFYLERGFYYEQLKRFFLLFPRDQLLVLKYADFVARPDATLQRICAFAGVDASFPFEGADRIHSPGPARPAMDAGFRELIERFYAASNARLLKLLGWDSLSPSPGAMR